MRFQFKLCNTLILILIFTFMGIPMNAKDKNYSNQKIPPDMIAYWYVVTTNSYGIYDADLLDFCSYPYKIKIKRTQTVNLKKYLYKSEKEIKFDVTKIKRDKYKQYDWSINYNWFDENVRPPIKYSGFFMFDSKNRKLFVPEGVSEEINYTRVECDTKDFNW